jgi:hypothetical protein
LLLHQEGAFDYRLTRGNHVLAADQREEAKRSQLDEEILAHGVWGPAQRIGSRRQRFLGGTRQPGDKAGGTIARVWESVKRFRLLALALVKEANYVVCALAGGIGLRRNKEAQYQWK